MYNFDVHVKKYLAIQLIHVPSIRQNIYLIVFFSINTEINMYKDPSSLLNRKKKMK